MKEQPDNKETSLTRSSAAEYLTFITAKGEGGVEAVYADEDVWLSQKMMVALYDVDVRTINYHLLKVFKDSELEENSVIRKFRITAADGKSYETQPYATVEAPAESRLELACDVNAGCLPRLVGIGV